MDQDQVRLGGLLGLFKIFQKGKFKLIHVGDKASYQLKVRVHSQANQHDDGGDQSGWREHPLHLVDRPHEEQGAGQGHDVAKAVQDREGDLKRTRI